MKYEVRIFDKTNDNSVTFIVNTNSQYEALKIALNEFLDNQLKYYKPYDRINQLSLSVRKVDAEL